MKEKFKKIAKKVLIVALLPLPILIILLIAKLLPEKRIKYIDEFIGEL
ncbi:MAG: hypothetical protein QW228_03435 [Candidatus Aenigmatarchaeota archaeon]